MLEEFARTGERAHLLVLRKVGARVGVLQPPGLLRREGASGLADQGLDEEAAAHADATVDAPDGEGDARLFERRAPGQHVLVDAVH